VISPQLLSPLFVREEFPRETQRSQGSPSLLAGRAEIRSFRHSADHALEPEQFVGFSPQLINWSDPLIDECGRAFSGLFRVSRFVVIRG